MPKGHRAQLGITDEQMPAMRRLWDEGLCDLEWTRLPVIEQLDICRACPVQTLCAQVGREGEETGDMWGGHCRDQSRRQELTIATKKRAAEQEREATGARLRAAERAASRRRAKTHAETDTTHCPAGHPRTGPGKCPQCAHANQRAWYLRLKARAVANGVSAEQQRRNERDARQAGRAA
jgi:hypothetical protein